MAMQYRKMELNDIDLFIKIRISQLKEEGAEPVIDLEPYLQDYYYRHLCDKTFVSWLALDNEKIIGTSGISFVEKPPYYGCPSGKIGLISSMFTVKEYRRQGIANTLLDKIVNEAKDCGCNLIQITASDRGVPFYSNYGFQKNSNFMFYSLKPQL